MSRRRQCPGCCTGDCAVIDDCFDRNGCQDAPTSTIGNGWTKDVVGDWTLESAIDAENADCPCSLVEAGTIGAQIINIQKTLKGAQRIEVDLHEGAESNEQTPTTGSIYRIFANYEDENNHVYVEIREHEYSFHNAGGGQIGITENQGWGDNAEEGLQWAACINTAGVFVAGHNYMETSPAHRCFAFNPRGKFAGLGNGSTVEIKYNKFVLEQHADTFPICHECCCRRCADTCIKDTLQVAVTSDCCVDGLSFNLEMIPHCEGEGSENIWAMPNPGPDTGPLGCWRPDCAPTGLEWEMTIVCQNPKATPRWKGWVLQTGVDGQEGCGGITFEFEPIAGSCTPFYLAFFFPEWGDSGGALPGVCPDNVEEDVGPTLFEVTQA